MLAYPRIQTDGKYETAFQVAKFVFSGAEPGKKFNHRGPTGIDLCGTITFHTIFAKPDGGMERGTSGEFPPIRNQSKVFSLARCKSVRFKQIASNVNPNLIPFSRSQNPQ